MSSSDVDLAGVLSLEDLYVRERLPTLSKALAALHRRWNGGLRDRETALRLLFLLWLSCREPNELTGLPEPQDNVLPAWHRLVEDIFETLGGAETTDLEILFVLWWLSTDASWCCGPESVWEGRSARFRSALLERGGLDQIRPDELLRGGAYGAYFSEILTAFHPDLRAGPAS